MNDPLCRHLQSHTAESAAAMQASALVPATAGELALVKCVPVEIASCPEATRAERSGCHSALPNAALIHGVELVKQHGYETEGHLLHFHR